MQELISRVDGLTKKVDEVREAMFDPDKTVLGRQLISRANENKGNIDRLGREKVDVEDFARLEATVKDVKAEVKDTTTWRTKMEGTMSFFRSAQVILGIITALLTILAINGKL